MRILFLVRSLGLGGAEVQLAQLARGLQERGHIVQVAALYAGGAMWEKLAEADIECLHLAKRSRWDLLSPLRRLKEVAHAFHPDIVYSFMPAANVLAALARSSLAPAALVWGVRASRADWRFYGKFPALLTRIEGHLSARPDLIICNSHAGRHYYLQSGWRARRMEVVENGFDLEAFRPDLEGRTRVRAELGVPPERCVVGIVGRIDPIKDHASFLRMAAVLQAHGRACEFWCIGAGEDAYVDSMRALAAELGVAPLVRWLGTRQDMRAVYSALDASCLTSLAEGFPNAAGESMACGTPCVTFDVGDAAAIVGDDALVVRTRDAQQLAAAVAHALDADGLRERSRERIAANFPLRRCVERSEECLRRVMAMV
jgi:glycosyltransferase involved in cell wall biosynthesis